MSLAKLRIAVLGSGPAGFYTASRILDKLPQAAVDMYEALPVPFGLSRFGVAPDHPEVKNCQDKFVETASNPNFRFVGNVEVGKDVGLKRVVDSYNSVVYAYGCVEDRILGVPGESLPGVMSARQFVGWYNGVPSLTDLLPPLSDAEDVVVVGNGNVALDVARILLCDVMRLKSTDICEHAYDTLRSSKVRRVRIVGRRGMLQSAFTNKEIRELVQEPGVHMLPVDPRYIDPYRPFERQFERPLKRMFGLVSKASKAAEENPAPPGSRQWSLEYLLSPTQFHASAANPALLSSTDFTVNRLDQADLATPAVAKVTTERTRFKSELAFRSIGYKSLSLPGSREVGLPFDEARGLIPNSLGRVVSDKKQLPGAYVAGWVKNGPTGVIAKTMWDSYQVGDSVLEDVAAGKIGAEAKPGFEDVQPHISSRVVSWADWLRLDAEEQRRGEAAGKSRSKFSSVTEMLEYLG